MEVSQMGPDEDPDSEGVKEKVGVEAVEFDHDPGCHGEPDRREYGCCGEELFHRWVDGCVDAVMGRGISVVKPSPCCRIP